MGKDTKGKTTKEKTVRPTESGISDIVVESSKGPRGSDDYTPIQSFEGLSRKLGQIFELASDIPDLKKITSESKEDIIAVKTELTVMRPRIERAEKILMEPQGHECKKEDVIASLTKSSESLDTNQTDLEKQIVQDDLRIKSIEKERDRYRNMRWQLITLVIGSISLIVAAIWYMSSLGTKVEMNERYFEDVKTELRAIRETNIDQVKSIKAVLKRRDIALPLKADGGTQ